MMNIRKLAILFLLILPATQLLSGQSLRPRASNIRMEIANDQVLVHYDLQGADPLTSHCITVFFSDIDLTNRIYPKAVSGDIGCGIRCSNNKTIVWDISKDKQVVNLELYCSILVDGVWGDGKTGGPGYAALSLIVPGLGDYFVADRRQMTFKPWMRTTLALGLTGLGVLSAEMRFREQRLVEGHWVYNFDRHTGTYVPVWIPDRYINGALNYYLFKDDAEVLITAGSAIWLTDVLWVMNKGRRNQKALQMRQGSGEAMLTPYVSLGRSSFSFGLSLRL